MKSIFVVLWSLMLLHSAIPHAQSVTIDNTLYGMKVECDAPYTAWVNVRQCNSGTLLDIVLLSSVDVQASKQSELQLLSCLAGAAMTMKPAGIKICNNVREVRFRAYDKHHVKFFEKREAY